MVSTTITTSIAAGQPTSSSNHHPHQQTPELQQQQRAATLGLTANAVAATANNSNYQRSTPQQQYQQQTFHYISSSASYFNSLTLNGDGDDNQNNSTNNNSKASSAHSKNRLETKTATLSGVRQENFIVGDHNPSRYTRRPSTSLLYNGGISIGGDDGDDQAKCDSNAATAEQTTDVEEEQTLGHETTTVTKSPTKTTTTSAVNLSQALLSSSSPLLNDQISLLFPKCRLRQQTPNDSNANIAIISSRNSFNTQSQKPTESSCDSDNLGLHEYELEYDKPTSSIYEREDSTVPNISTISSPSTKTTTRPLTTSTNYYRSVNIITQSPPPPSTSSVSSESLSSVTPRISTNPFRNHTTANKVEEARATRQHAHKYSGTVGDGNSSLSTRRTSNDQREAGRYHSAHIIGGEEENKYARNREGEDALLANDHDDIVDEGNEDLPVPSYPSTIYYHTETNPTRQRHHQSTSDNSNSYEMPRKRASYGSHHHVQQQPYTQFFGSSTTQQQPIQKQIGNNSAQNPFIKDDNYWDSVRQVSASETSAGVHTVDNTELTCSPDYNSEHVVDSNYTAATAAVTESPVLSSTVATAPMVSATSLSYTRRSYNQQQPYTNNSNGVPPRRNQPKESQSQPHTNRFSRSASDYGLGGQQFAESASKRNKYHQKQQQQNSLQAVQNSCAEGLTPLASHYLYGSKTSLNQTQQQQQKHESDNSILVERELKERDREQREQRKAVAGHSEWQRERERDHEWKLERGYARDKVEENDVESEKDGERDHVYHRPQARRRNSYLDGVQQYQATKNRNSLKMSKRDERNGHSTVSNGEAVGFDDITESWQNLRVTTDTSAPTMPTTSTRQHFQQRQQQQQQHHRPQPNTSLTLANDKEEEEEYVKQFVVNNHLDDVEVTGSRSNTNNNSTSSIMYKDHPNRYLDRSGYTMTAVETRHGIIEYDGSPRRIGVQTTGVVPATDDEVDELQEGEEEVAGITVEDVDVDVGRIVQSKSQEYLRQSQELITKAAATTIASSNNSGSVGGGDGGGSSQHTTNTIHDSPQQPYTARPGFPQRIISTQRDSTSPIMLLNHNNSKQLQQKQHQQQQLLQVQQAPLAQPQRQSSPPTAFTLDNNAEDTSNDVSEIGTISDLTTPEAISATTGTPIYTTDSPAANATSANTAMPPTSATGYACKPLTTFSSSAFSIPTKSSTFDYLYEFSETRKVLEEFFKCPSIDDRPIENVSDVDSIDIQYEFHSNLDRNDDDEMDSPCIANADDNDDDVEEAEDEYDDDDGLMGVDMDGIQSEQHHHQLQQQHNNQMRQLQTTLQQRNNQRETQFHTQQTSPTPIPTTTQYRLQQQQQKQQLETYPQKQQQALQQVQVQVQQQHQQQRGEEQQQPVHHLNNHRSVRPQRQQQPQLNNSSNNSINNSIIYNNSSHSAPHRRRFTASPLMRDFDFFLDSASRSSGEQLDQQDGVNHNQMETPSTYRYSPETTDYDSNCGDLDSLSGEINGGVSTSCSNYTKYYASSMPVLEDGLSSGHTSDTENNNQNNLNRNLQQPSAAINHNTIGSGGGISMLMDMKRFSTNNSINSMNNLTISTTDGCGGGAGAEPRNNSLSSNILQETNFMRRNDSPTAATDMHENSGRDSVRSGSKRDGRERELLGHSPTNISTSNKVFKNIDPDLDSLYSISIFHRPDMVQMTPPPPAPAPHRKPNIVNPEMEILQPTPYKENLHSIATAPSTTAPLNPLSTSAGTTTGSGITSVASAISTTLNRNKMHTQQQSQSSSIGNGNASSGLTNALSTNQTHAPTHVAPTPALTSSVVTSLSQSLPTSQTHSINLNQTQSQPQTQPPPPIPERNIPSLRTPSPVMNSPVWLSRHLDNSASKSLLRSSPGHHSKNMSADEDDVDTDLETDRLLGHQRLDDQGYYDENKSWESRKPRSSLLSKISPKQQNASTKTRNGYNALLSTTPEIPPPIPPKNSTNKLLDIGGSMSSPEHSDKSPLKSLDVQDCVVTMGSPGGSDGSACISGTSKKQHDLTTITTNGLAANGGGNSSGVSGTTGGIGSGVVGTTNANGVSGGGSGNGVVGGHSNSTGSNSTSGEKKVKKSKNKEVLIEGVLFRAKYLGSTQLVCEGQPTKSTRMMQAEEAVSRIKAPDGDVQPSTEVDLFISTEKIMVLNTDLKEIMMDHALRTISYIADIGDLVVLMARRRFVPQDIDDAPKPNRTPKMICHVFESDEAQFIAQSIGQAFQVAYMEFLKANGIEDHSFVKEMDYQEVLNSQEIFGDELEIFAKKELQKEVVVPKAKGEILGVVIVESGWGSMLPTVVIANLMSSGAAARCGQLNIGDQLIAINGLSLVGLPLSTCQTYIKNTKNQTVVKFTVVPCAPVVEVKIKRPNTKYQLGFSVQNGVICSLLRGGIAERGGVRVGHRIIEINNQSVVAVPHEKIVNLLATSVGEILMKTMPTSMFRLLTGQENPIYI
ncbi:serine-rich adhesin for platelets isoform X2 [Eurosta solidaginis]|uniref:serine-rich adhesin for platelets isoform X2 n=1 Tax=Eurosta solidaginis TaxID=178769 RepID=UPI0035313BDC